MYFLFLKYVIHYLYGCKYSDSPNCNYCDELDDSTHIFVTFIILSGLFQLTQSLIRKLTPTIDKIPVWWYIIGVNNNMYVIWCPSWFLFILLQSFLSFLILCTLKYKFIRCLNSEKVSTISVSILLDEFFSSVIL